MLMPNLATRRIAATSLMLWLTLLLGPTPGLRAELTNDAWLMTGQDTTRWSNNAASALEPPISLYALSRGPAFGNIEHRLIHDGRRVYQYDNHTVRAFDPLDTAPEEDGLLRPAERWQYGLDQEELREQQLEKAFQPRPGAVISRGRVIFLQDELNPTTPTWTIKALNSSSGTQAWEIPLENVTWADILSDGLNLYTIYRSTEPASYLMAYSTIDGTPAWNEPVLLDNAVNVTTLMGLLDGVLVRTQGLRFIMGHSATDGSLLWTYEMDTFSNLQRNEFVLTGGKVIVSRDASVYGINLADGTEAWKVTDACAGTPPGFPTLTDGNIVVHVGACGQEGIAARSVETGAEVWSTTIPNGFLSRTAAVIAGDVLFVLYDNFLSLSPTLGMFSMADGSLLDEYDTGLFLAYDLISVDNLLYLIGIENGAEQYGVFAFEREPADLALEMIEQPECNAIVGGRVRFQFNVVNNGPGLAKDIRLRADYRTQNGVFTVTGVDNPGTGTGQIFYDLGQLEPGQSRLVTVDAEPTAPNLHTVELEVTHALRDPDLGNSEYRRSLSAVALPPGGIDLDVTAMEITQGIQNLANDVFLVADKDTLVRVYVETGGVGVPGVEALLHGRRDGIDLPGSPLEVISGGCTDLSATGPDRAILDDTLNFILPIEWRNGTVELTVEVDPEGVLPDNSLANNVLAENAVFVEVAPIGIKAYRVHTEDDNGNSLKPNPFVVLQGLNEAIARRNLTLVPTARVFIRGVTGSLLEELEFTGFGPYELGDDSWKIQAKLWTKDQFSNDPDEWDALFARTHHLGYVDGRTAGGFNGIGLIGGDSTTVQMRGSAVTGSVGINEPRGGRTLAHELGHNYSRDHVNCGGPEDPDGNYPHPPCQFSPGGPDSFWGVDLFDVENIAVIEPTTVGDDSGIGDLMSYSDDRWPSDYTWLAMMQELYCQRTDLCVWPPPETQGLPPVTASTLSRLERLKAKPGAAKILQSGEALLVSGVLGEVDELTSVWRSQTADLPQPNLLQLWTDQVERNQTGGDYTLELLGPGDTVLDTLTLDVRPFGDRETMMFFGTALPWSNGTETIRVRQDQAVLLERAVSANAPSVQVFQPGAGSTQSGEITVTWSSFDADGDDLTHAVRYTNDGGATWTMLAEGIPGTSTVIDSSLLPGGTGACRFQVIANDGVNTGIGNSGLFTIDNRNPLTGITNPLDGRTLRSGELIVARGWSFDPEDGNLEGASLTWDVEGIVLGTGGEVQFRLEQPGEYTLTLTATDADGNASQDTSAIKVLSTGGPLFEASSRDWLLYR